MTDSNNQITHKENEEQKTNVWLFMLSFGIVFSVSFFFLSLIGSTFSSEEGVEVSVNVMDDSLDDEVVFVEPVAEPMRIVIPSVSIDATILNPQSRDITVLDTALQSGAVRYPGSGLLGEKKDMFLFGHSTNWDVVQNQAYKSFNDIESVGKDELIRIHSNDREYVYSVASVSMVSANTAWVKIEDKNKLFISTCNTFGKKTDRFVVEADFVASYPLTT